MTKTIRGVLAGALIAALCASAAAQTQRVKGTIEKVDGNVLTVKTAQGAQERIALADNANIVAVVRASMADIKEGTFLGSAAMPQADGTQKAVEVHIFPEKMRGTGEGHRAYDPVPGGTMTNGAASGATVTGVDGGTMTVKYKGGEKKITIRPDTIILTYVAAEKSELKPGTSVSVNGVVKAGGAVEARRIVVGRGGVIPS